MSRILVLLLVASVVALAIWDILRRNPQLRDRLRGDLRPPPPPKAEAPRRAPPDRPVAPRGKVIALRRDPYQILGLDRDATPEEVRAVVARVRAEHDPTRLAGMATDLQEFAQRRVEEVESAARQLLGDDALDTPS